MEHASRSGVQRFLPLMKLLGSSYSEPTLDSALSHFNLLNTHIQNFSGFTIMTIVSPPLHTHTKSTKLPLSLHARLTTLSKDGPKTNVSETCSVATVRTGHVSETLGRSLASLVVQDQFRNFFFLQKLNVFRSLYVRAFPDFVRNPHKKQNYACMEN